MTHWTQQIKDLERLGYKIDTMSYDTSTNIFSAHILQKGPTSWGELKKKGYNVTARELHGGIVKIIWVIDAFPKLETKKPKVLPKPKPRAKAKAVDKKEAEVIRDKTL